MIIKKRFKKLFAKIGIIASCVGVAISTLCIVPKAYSINNDGNLISSNVVSFNYNDGQTFTSNGVTLKYYKSTGTFVANGTSNGGSNFWLVLANPITSGQYIANMFSNNIYTYMYLTNPGVWGGQTLNTTSSFVLTETKREILLQFYQGQTYNNVTITPMIVQGNIRPTQWEPYGVWYSQGNYDIANLTHSTIYNSFNGAKCWLFEYNGQSLSELINSTSTQALYTETINLNIDTSKLTFGNLPNIYRYLLQEYSDEYIVLIKLDKPCLASFYVNSRDDFNMNFMYRTIDTNNNIKNDLSDIVHGEEYVSIQNDYLTNYIAFNGDGADFGGIGELLLIDSNYSYNLGYQNGYGNGYGLGSEETYHEAYLQAEKDYKNKVIIDSASYNQGKTDGFNLGADSQNSLYNMVIAVADTPVRIFKQVFDFNILGINISNIVLSLLSLSIIIWLIKKLI